MQTSLHREGWALRAFRSLFHMATLIGLVTLGVCWIAISLYLVDQRNHTTESAEQNGANLARAFEEQIARSIKSVDQALLFVRAQFQREPDTFDLQTWGQNDYYLRDLAVQLAIINANGFLRASNADTSAAAVDLSDREHFRFHVNRPTDDLFISKPVLGRVTNKWTIQLTRKLRKPDGSFGGVLVASIDPGYLSKFYESIDVGRGGGITLIGTDGIIRARGARSGDDLGKEITSKFLLDLAAQKPAGTYLGAGAVDGVPRLVSYRKVKDFPLIVTVALDPVEIYASFNESRSKLIKTGGVFSAFVFLAIAWASRQKLRLESTQHALIDKSETLGSTLANMSQGVIVVDDDGRVVVLNDQALSILEISPEDYIVPFEFSLLSRLGFERRQEPAGFDPEGTSVSGGVEWVMPGGKIVEVREASLPSGGEIITLTDVTRRRHYQQNLEEALERAETASRARSSFLANMSHEMRTPLNGVISMTDLLTETHLDGDQQHYVDVAKSSAEHLLQLIDDILDVSKLEADQVKFETLTFDVHAVVNDALEIVAPKAHEKGLTVGAFIAPAIPRQLLGDPGRIRQILINLLGNGVKFTASGHVHVEVAADWSSDHTLVLRFDVEDTGIGIPAEHLPALFREFSQIDSSISRRYGGTGLGLSICRKLASRMGGSISIESEVGRGTTFHVILPLLLPDDASASLTQGGLEDIRVGLISRDSYFIALLSRQIEGVGGQVEVFKDFTSASKSLSAGIHGSLRPVLIVDLDENSEVLSIPFTQSGPFAILPISANRANSFAGVTLDWLLRKPLSQDVLVQQLGDIARGISLRSDSVSLPKVQETATLSLPFKILVAEDNVTNQFAIRRILENMGADVTVVSNGKEAVDSVAQVRYDVVLMDMMMPEMDGLSATRAIRQLPAPACHVPIVALTANAFKEDQEAAIASGMDGFTTKPTNRTKLHAAVRDVLRSENSASYNTSLTEGIADDTLDSELLSSFLTEMGEDAKLAIDQFISDVEERFVRIRQAGSKAAVVERDSHAIKSAAGMLGLKRLAKAAAELEKLCKAEREATVQHEVEALRKTFDDARVLLANVA